MGGVKSQDVLKTGHLLKQGHFLKNWKMRMFQLCKDNLTYGHLQKGTRGVIPLKDIKVRFDLSLSLDGERARSVSPGETSN